VNLGISSTLFERQPGHVRGAFTDARSDRKGRFDRRRRRSSWTIGDLDPASQVKMLRVLQDRSPDAGSSQRRDVDVRVVSTNRNLASS
jgi:transcriptional regulator with GAF, ATPase, and Fis domain